MDHDILFWVGIVSGVLTVAVIGLAIWFIYFLFTQIDEDRTGHGP